GGGDDGSGGGGPSDADVDRLIYLITPPSQVGDGQEFTVRVALVDASGNIVPLSGVFIYLDLFQEGEDHPTNTYLRGERFENTENGVAELVIRVEEEGRYQLRALTDDLPSHQPHGPEPYLFSETFTVN
ncbi:MAG TPA: hypothetical protein VHH32_12845, partial [Gemmatimonadales bacterium]|nr:hypothetical protein [Gemmatimonadales bacterium]